MAKLKSSCGKIAEDESFWDRDVERKLFIERIKEDDSILMIAQRRIGKTSLMKQVSKELANDYYCLFVDLQDGKSPADLIAFLSSETHQYKNIWNKVSGIFKNIFQAATNKIEEVSAYNIKIKIRSGLTAGNWKEKGEQILNILAAADKPVVIFFDELPILISKMIEIQDDKITNTSKELVNDMMSWLRKISLDYQKRIHLVFAGSIGLEPILNRLSLTAVINHLYPFKLEPWDNETAIGCIKALAESANIAIEETALKKMTKLLGCCIPHHVQMFFANIYEHCTKKSISKCTSSIVDEVYKREMLGTRGHTELTHYEERLEMVLTKPQLRLALEMLTETSIHNSLTKEHILKFKEFYSQEVPDIQKNQKYILWVLEHDGYLVKKQNKYVFVSKLLRDWWKARHSGYHVSILKR